MTRQELEPLIASRRDPARVRRTAALAVCISAFGWAVVVAGAGQGTTTGVGLTFRAQEIATGFGVGYAVAAGDVNGDGRMDILAISGTELAWFQNPTWQKHTILGPGAQPRSARAAGRRCSPTM